MRLLLAVALIATAACSAPATASPSPSATTAAPTASPTPSPTATPSPTPAASPTPPPITLPSFAQLSAPNIDVLWVLMAASRLFRSTDRGATWTERSLPSQPLQPADIAFVSDREGWILAPGSPATQCQTQPYALWHTADGATTWERTYQSDQSTDPLCKTFLGFADAQRGWVTLQSTNAAPSFARTLNGGKTFDRSNALPDPPGFTTQQGGFTLRPGRVKAFGTTLLVSATGQTQTGSANYAFRSTDDGLSWRFVSAAPNPFSDIVFITPTRWLQIAEGTQHSETTDAGASWHAFTSDYTQAAPLAPQIVFGDGNIGYATVRGSIQRTIDGGAHWTLIKTPGT